MEYIGIKYRERRRYKPPQMKFYQINFKNSKSIPILKSKSLEESKCEIVKNKLADEEIFILNPDSSNTNTNAEADSFSRRRSFFI